MQERTREIEFLNCSVFFGQPDHYGLDQIAVRVDSLKVRFGEHTVLKKLEGRMASFNNYLSLLLRLKNEVLRPRHWSMLMAQTNVSVPR